MSFYPRKNKMNVEEDITPEQLEGVTMHYVTPSTKCLALRFRARSAAHVVEVGRAMSQPVG